MYVNILRPIYTNSNRELSGEVYYTMPRFKSITIQCLEALLRGLEALLRGLGLIECDLKPQNILVKSYSRCELVAAVSRQITSSPMSS